MDITITAGKLSGHVTAIPSKSQAHRLMIFAAFADKQTELHCPETNRDIQATADCLRSLGAAITRTGYCYTVKPVTQVPDSPVLNCCESGSTLRFLLPIVGALGVDALFQMEGRLPQRPLSPLWEEMERMGCTLIRPAADTIRCFGKLHPSYYHLDGSVSTQFITGLHFAASLLEDNSTINITGTLEFKHDVEMPQNAMKLFCIDTEGYQLIGCFLIISYHPSLLHI